MKVYTRTGDDGTTGLYFGGRARKDDPAPHAYGDVDEAQAMIGLARAVADVDLDARLVALERDLWVLMAELATAPENRRKLIDGETRVTPTMVTALEDEIDSVAERFAMPTEFVVPGQNEVAARLDVARTVVRRAERSALAVAAEDSHVISYLNRLSDLLWTLARWQEDEVLLTRGEKPDDAPT